MLLLTLHSNLVIFKWCCHPLGSVPGLLLHSNLVIFKFCKWPSFLGLVFFYIPIWLYSNLGHQLSKYWCVVVLHSNLVIFKCLKITRRFHSMTILHSNLVMFKCRFASIATRGFRFTFQSGYVQMMIKEKEIMSEKTLHSNLVMFKSSSISIPAL